MLPGVLHSQRAVQLNAKTMRTFSWLGFSVEFVEKSLYFPAQHR
jgi:hypothetical protein